MADNEEQAGPLTLTITEEAHAKILELLEARGMKEDGALRITVEDVTFAGPEYGMALVEQSSATDTDVAIDGEGFPVLVDAEHVPYVNGAVVGYYDTLFQQGFQIDPPENLPGPEEVQPRVNWDDPVAQRVQQVIDQMVNPGVASHGGYVELLDVQGDRIYVRMGGGCQGCGMASVTLKQGVEQLVTQHVPEIHEVIDTTDHAGGTNPYYQPSKGAAAGASPFYSPAKG